MRINVQNTWESKKQEGLKGPMLVPRTGLGGDSRCPLGCLQTIQKIMLSPPSLCCTPQGVPHSGTGTNWGSSKQTLLHHLPGRLALGFRCLYSMMGLQERCIRNVCGLQFPQDRKKENPNPGPAFEFKLYYFKLHYFSQGFKGLRIEFHKEISSRKTILFSLSSNHLKRDKVIFF